MSTASVPPPTAGAGTGVLVRPEDFHQAGATAQAVTATPAAPARPAPHVVEIKNVSKTFTKDGRSFTAVRDVNFTVEDHPGVGEFISILGPSGCGKSTVIRMIAGLSPQHPASTGTVKVFGQLVGGPGADRGMVFQDYTSFDHLSVLDNIAFGLKLRGMPVKERHALAMEWVAKVGLNKDTDARKFPHELSGGMRQRVAIARTLILKPRIILMDEPFGALDPGTRSSMQDLLKQLWHEQQSTVFFITHALDEAVYLGDRALIFSRAPGTIAHDLKLPGGLKPVREMQRDPEFQAAIGQVREIMEQLEHPG